MPPNATYFDWSPWVNNPELAMFAFGIVFAGCVTLISIFLRILRRASSHE